ncbi:MAG: HAMP domain-containing sensor histidine kinase [Planctomycetota bacterium]|nr:HAMP domain-containing sensor histidine kinase [Planctomycetota bacterium]
MSPGSYKSQRWNQLWNLRVKLALLLACLLAGTLAVQDYLEELKRQRLIDAVEQMAGDIAAEAVELTIRATAMVPAVVPSMKSNWQVTFQANTLSPGTRQLQFSKETNQFIADVKRVILLEESAYAFGPTEKYLLRSGTDDLVRALIQKNHPDLAFDAAILKRAAVKRSAPLLRTEGGSRMREEKDKQALYSSPNRTRTPSSEVRAVQTELAMGIGESSAVDSILAAPEMDRNQTDDADIGGQEQFFFDPRSVMESGFTDGDPDDVMLGGIELKPHLDRFHQLVNEARYYDLTATIAVFLVGLVLAWVLGTRLMQPVTEVVEGMRKVAQGELSVRLRERNDPEFGLVTRQFNDMVLRIEDARSIERGLEHRERVQSMGDLAAGVAHDIRNPLIAISLHVGRIRREFVPTETEDRKRFLSFTGDVKEEIERLDCLVTDFLQLAQPGTHDPEQINPGELLENLRRLLEKEASVRKVELEVQIQDGMCEVLWNRVEAKSAFLNIAMNALQAMEADGGSLRMTARSDEQWIVISFIDDGPGIEDRDLERVMLPYVTMRPGGTGLGLAIARRVAERHGGRLELDSEVGVGTEVRFLLPVEKGAKR